MKSSSLPATLAAFRRQMRLLHVASVAGAIGFITALAGAYTFGPSNHRHLAFGAMFTLVAVYLLLTLRSIRLTREIQVGGVLMSIGKLADAEFWLRRGMTRFSLSAPAKLVAGELLATLFFQRGAYADAVSICREVLRYPLARARHVWVNTRILLADSLLMLDRVNEAHAALLPMVDVALSLEARMKLLPVQLRYELAAGDAASCVSALAEKVRLAELLDSTHAALVHALLAEACRRQAMPVQQTFLAERARLYHDLNALTSRFPIIAPVALGDE